MPAIIGAALLGALGRRVAGGLLSQWLGRDLGDWPVRGVWGALMVVALALSGAGWWSAVGLSMPLGCALYGNKGRTLAVPLDWLRMAAHGFLVLALPGAVSVWLGGDWWTLSAAVVLTPACCWIANRWPLGRWAQRFTDYGPGPTGELLCGAVWGAAAAWGLL